MRKAILVGILWAMHSPALSQGLEEKTESLMAARTISCRFGRGYTADWRHGEPAITSGAFTSTGFLIIRSIDHVNRRATIGANIGESPVVVVTNQSALHFVEVTESGNVTVTTVYAATKNGRHVAVHSRNMVVLAIPAPSQFHGLCQLVN